MTVTHRVIRFGRSSDGASAVELGIIALPLLLLLFAILEVSILFFVNTSLDIGMAKVSRRIRTGEVQTAGLTQAKVKEAICAEISNSFACAANLKLKVDVVADIAALQATNPIDGSGAFAVTETYNAGKGGDYIVMQAFLPWTAFVNLYSLSNAKTASNSYAVVSSVLFRNESF